MSNISKTANLIKHLQKKNNIYFSLFIDKNNGTLFVFGRINDIRHPITSHFVQLLNRHPMIPKR